MAEVSFAKSLLQLIDSRPVKLQADWATDLKTLELKVPYTLPRMSQPMRRRADTTTTTDASTTSGTTGTTPAPGSEPSITTTFKSMKPPTISARLDRQPYTTSILELKKGLASALNLVDGSVEGIKLLFKSKPCADSKTIRDVLAGEESGEVEFKVMFVGGGPAFKDAAPSGQGEKGQSPQQQPPEPESVAATPVAQGESGQSVLQGTEFWQDLKGFLGQRIRDQGVAEQAVAVFRKAWEQSEENEANYR